MKKKENMIIITKLTRKEFGELDIRDRHWVIYNSIRAGFCVLASMLTNTKSLPCAKEIFDDIVSKSLKD